MVWFVQPRELKSPDGGRSGKWRLCAESDEDGGFHPLCPHEHSSPEEARDCPEAIVREGHVTGFPRIPRDTRTIGQIGYDAYRQHRGGKSLATGHRIPEWPELHQSIRDAWEAAGNAMRNG